MATVETFFKAAKIKPDGYLPGGLPYIRATTLEKLEREAGVKPFTPDAVPVEHVVRKNVSPRNGFLKAVAHAIMKAETPDQAATIAHRAEQVIKARVRSENPVDVERNTKLAWIDGEAKKLRAKGRTATDAINEAMRNWASQHNSPGDQ